MVDKDFKRKNEIETNFGAERNFLQKTDRILSGRDTLKVRKGDPSSDAKRFIWLPFDQTEKEVRIEGGDYKDYLTLLKGYNYHELSHTLFTETAKDDAVDKMRVFLEDGYGSKYVGTDHRTKRELGNVINRLEDCRIEMKFSKLYNSAEKYFRAVADSNKGNVGFVDAYGRKFLNNKFRKAKEKEFIRENSQVDEKTVKELKEKIDSFILEQDDEERLRKAGEIYHTLKEADTLDTNKDGPQPDRDGYGEGYKNNKVGKKKEQEIQDEMEKDVEQDNMEDAESEDEAEEESADGEKTGNNIGEDGKKDDGNEGTGEGGNEYETLEEVLEDMDEEGMNSDSETSGEIDGNIDGDLNSDNIAEEDYENIKDEIEDDLKEDIDTIKQGGGWSPYTKGDGGKKGKPKTGIDRDMDELRVKKKQVVRTIEDIRADLKQKWKRGKKRGKFDMRKAMQAKKKATTRVFKRYEKGRLNETRLGVVLLIDRSGSMCQSKRIGGASRKMKAEQAEWILIEALEETGNKVSTLAFNTDVRNLKDWHQNTTYDISPRGGTDPTKALFIASKKVEDVLQYDEDINPLVIMVTDGEYDPTHQSYSSDYSPKDNAEMIKREYDGKVAEIRLSEGRDSRDSYKEKREEAFDFAEEIEDMDELPMVMEKILKEVEEEFVEKYRKQGGRQ